MTWSSLVPFLGILISGCIGGLTVWLALRKRLEEETLGRASRRTTAMQLLSDEEFTLEQVRDECVAIETLVEVGRFKTTRQHLLSESARIKQEASAMLTEVRARRAQIGPVLLQLAPAELESAIAAAYHGKRQAETQLKRTQLSRTEILKRFEDVE